MGKTKSGGAGKAAAKAAKKEKQAEKAAKKEQQAVKAATKGKGKGAAAAADDEEDLDAILERYKREMEAVSLKAGLTKLTCSLLPTPSRRWNRLLHRALAPCSWHPPPLYLRRVITCT